MTRLEAQAIVSRMRRQLALAVLTRVGLLCGVLLGLYIVWTGEAERRGDVGLSIGTLVAVIWMTLTALSARQVRAANQSAGYIAAGRLDLAEEQLKGAMRLFSLFRSAKLMVCHNLAVVVHGQKNYHAAAELCDGVVRAARGFSSNLVRICRILLADCRLLLGDRAAARVALAPLTVTDASLSLPEQLMLLPIELRSQVSNGEYERAVEQLSWKTSRAELLDAPRAALVHALLGQACRARGRQPEAEFFQRRAALYHDLKELETEYRLSLQ